MAVRIPTDKPVFETPLAHCWMDKTTLCILPKNVPRSGPATEAHYKVIRERTGARLCWLIYFQICTHFDASTRGIIYSQLPALCKALAIIANKPCEKMLASQFLKVPDKTVPVRLFQSEKEAREWLSGFE